MDFDTETRATAPKAYWEAFDAAVTFALQVTPAQFLPALRATSTYRNAARARWVAAKAALHAADDAYAANKNAATYAAAKDAEKTVIDLYDVYAGLQGFVVGIKKVIRDARKARIAAAHQAI